MSQEVIEPSASITKIGDKTFNRLCELQKLIQKESALKKLCKY